MHELAICQALMRQIDAIALRENAARITAVFLEVGPLSGTEPRLLAEAFPIAAAGSVAQSAELRIKEADVTLLCRNCGAESTTRPNKLVCSRCGDLRTTLVSGSELLLTSVELERNETVPIAGSSMRN